VTGLLAADPERCAACGRCLAVCPHRIPIPGADGIPLAEPPGAATCILCGQCVAACPTDALAHRDLGRQGFLPGAPPPAPDAALAWLRGRRSVRAYQGQPVSRETAEALLEAARHAPTGHNSRDLGCVAVLSAARRERLREEVVAFYRRLFAVVRRPPGRVCLGLVFGRGRVRELVEALPGMAGTEERLRRGEDPLFHGAPAVLLFHAPAAETAEMDCGAAATQVTLLAPSLGLGTCHIGYASAVLKRFPRMGRRFGVPPGHRVYAVLTLGKPAAEYVRVPPRPRVALRCV